MRRSLQLTPPVPDNNHPIRDPLQVLASGRQAWRAGPRLVDPGRPAWGGCLQGQERPLELRDESELFLASVPCAPLQSLRSHARSRDAGVN